MSGLSNRPDASHSVEVGTLTQTGTALSVGYRDVRITSGSCLFTQAVTQPYFLIAVPRADTVQFSGAIVQRSCP